MKIDKIFADNNYLKTLTEYINKTWIAKLHNIDNIV